MYCGADSRIEDSAQKMKASVLKHILTIDSEEVSDRAYFQERLRHFLRKAQEETFKVAWRKGIDEMPLISVWM